MSDLDEIRLARIALTSVAEPGDPVTYRLVRDLGPVEALRQVLRTELADPVTRNAVAARLAVGDPRASAEAGLARAERLGARVVIPEDAEWPPQVHELEALMRDTQKRKERDTAPPLCLWVRGERPVLFA